MEIAFIGVASTDPDVDVADVEVEAEVEVDMEAFLMLFSVVFTDAIVVCVFPVIVGGDMAVLVVNFI